MYFKVKRSIVTLNHLKCWLSKERIQVAERYWDGCVNFSAFSNTYFKEKHMWGKNALPLSSHISFAINPLAKRELGNPFMEPELDFVIIRMKILTLTCWYRNVKYAAGGRKPITAQANTKILVRIGQFNAATHGDASLQASHPSAHGKQWYEFGLL